MLFYSCLGETITLFSRFLTDVSCMYSMMRHAIQKKYYFVKFCMNSGGSQHYKKCKADARTLPSLISSTMHLFSDINMLSYSTPSIDNVIHHFLFLILIYWLLKNSVISFTHKFLSSGLSEEFFKKRIFNKNVLNYNLTTGSGCTNKTDDIIYVRLPVFQALHKLPQ